MLELKQIKEIKFQICADVVATSVETLGLRLLRIASTGRLDVG